jgi:DNA-binding transcriptional ArsR family regulator
MRDEWFRVLTDPNRRAVLLELHDGSGGSITLPEDLPGDGETPASRARRVHHTLPSLLDSGLVELDGEGETDREGVVHLRRGPEFERLAPLLDTLLADGDGEEA